MKRIYNFYCLFVVLVLITGSCSKQLDLRPENNLVEDQVLEDKVTTERLLAGGFYSQFLAERILLPVVDQSTGIAFLNTNNYYNGTIDANLIAAFDIWSKHYQVINIANVIINNLPKQAKFDLSLQKQYIAEAKFLRAYSYFHLALLYGDRVLSNGADANPCVPLRLDAFDRSDGSQILPRSTNRQVLDQVVKDLEEAIPDLPNNYPEAINMDVKLRSRAAKSVGRAFLSRVYLYLNNYDGAINNANQVLADNNYVFAASPADVFPDNSAVITGPTNIPFNKEVVYGYPVSWNAALSSESANNLFYQVDLTFLSTYDVNDSRGTKMTWMDNTTLRSKKYNSPRLYDNMMIIRLSEVMLNKAEALVRRDGVNQTAIDILNAIYQRAFVAGKKPIPYTLSSFASTDALLSRILQERRWELAFEGHSRFDRLRAGLPINPVLPVNKYAFPVPQKEIDITSGVLKQNPGYLQ